MPSLDALGLGLGGNILAAEQHAPACRGQRAGKQIDKCGLAGSVRSDQRVARAGGELKVDVVHGNQCAEMAAEGPRL